MEHWTEYLRPRRPRPWLPGLPRDGLDLHQPWKLPGLGASDLAAASVDRVMSSGPEKGSDSPGPLASGTEPRQRAKDALQDPR